jgi:PKD repeat protein
MRRSLARCATLVAALGILLALSASQAAAATQTLNVQLSGGSTTHIFDLTGLCDDCWPDGSSGTNFLGIQVGVDMATNWSAPSKFDLNYTQSNLRQGSTLDLADTLTNSDGTINVNYTASVVLGRFFSADNNPADATPTSDTLSFSVSQPDSATCAVPLPGDSPRTCSHTTSIPIFDGTVLGVVGVTLTVPITTTFSVSSDGVVTLRQASIAGGQPIPDNTLDFNGTSPQTLGDPIPIGCNQPAGQDLIYNLTNIGTNISGSVQESASLHLKATIIITIFDGDLVTLSAPPVEFNGFSMTGPNQQADLGPVLPDITPPTINGVTTNGSLVEGSDVNFVASAVDNCGPTGLSYDWRYSDGGESFGASTHHVFADNGTYTVELVVEDTNGNETELDFPVSIANANPVVSPIAAHSAEWGDPISFHADATDPGSADQPTLVYSWLFGDGNAANGQNVAHSYSMPGTYTDMVTVTDKDGGSASQSSIVTIGKRATTLTYTGSNAALPNKLVTLSATLIDDHGQAVAGRTVNFMLGSQSASASTNSAGVATVSLKLNQHNGTYSLTTSFGGDGLYLASSGATVSFKIGNNP